MQFVCDILINCIFIISTTYIMSSKPTRVRKLANRNPTSLALPIPDPILKPAANPSLQIDLQLASLDIATALNDIDVAINYSPFSDAILSRSPSPDISGPTPGSVQSDSVELFEQAVISYNSQQPIPTTQGLVLQKKGFTWNYTMEEALFQELLNQANNGKRADSGFKKEAWIGACIAVAALTTQDITVERCKSKAEVMKGLWKEFM
jgi:hypothetical protein